MTCTMCPTQLTGQQRKYCSDVCRARGFNAARIADGRLKAYRKRDDVRARNIERRRTVRYTQTFTCQRCGVKHTNRRGDQAKYCSLRCSRPRRPPIPKAAPVDTRGKLRIAWECSDWDAIKHEMLARTTATDGGCRLWTGAVNADGYATVTIARKRRTAYRVMAIAIQQGQFGSAPVHHTCSNKTCINPVHLQIVTPLANTAEMLNRKWYERRIAALEAALAEIAPDHQLLKVLGFADVA